MSEYDNQLKRMRAAFAASIVKSMTPEEINNTFQKLHDENEALKQRAEKAERELSQKKLIHIGYTNGCQIFYAQEDEGAFYPDTNNDCYIPLYMFDSHTHRLETTLSEDEANQLRAQLEGVSDD